ncbi:PssD/Cps14F family polysaccharide biosynthesis glycosyltransferase [Enterococcus faecium]|uniref:PssD/Cps14F family polysaccharide biosynthesis glycosyltransferase n=1 Tax=Enterococcus faecium TaxID=1352 RepID=UPI001883FC44|nr:PssD/Cps14F family polysaccharide biosynthesis glycosyltransferase [Enterococcus faecium]EME5381309.1 polysaccharide biosynthesis protein [Enterococcus faecium]MBE9871849.1 polysaccharide biosynthesis protein [Enterococcus faecium]MDK4437924.1 UDP-N-acetylglucosamine transferase subunit ALG14 [Enterococcus faecium]HBL8370094.1 polysaccharide biosynthesis protein [Enterococcus faecium]
MEKRKKVCFISSSGGHLEQLKQLKMVAERYNHYYVLPKNESTIKFKEKKYLVGDFYRKNRIQFLFRFAFTAAQQLIIFIKERPDVVITTGAGVVIPTCLYAHFFGKKLIYIESFARMKSLNKTAETLRRYTDLFIVQWEDLLEIVPEAVYGGWLY